MKTTFAATCLLLFVQNVAASGLTVLGIKFDEPFSPSTCAYIGFVEGKERVAMSKVTQPCVLPSDENRWQGRPVRVWIPFLSMPKALKNPITVSFEGDRPSMMRLTFEGVSASGAALSTVKEKFGPPTNEQTVVKQNAMGAKFEVPEADWLSDAFEVSFRVTALDDGVITILGPHGVQKKRDRARAEQNTPKPSL